MEWKKLLSTEKLTQEEEEPRHFAQYPINAFELDYNKIVSSAAFRRLQDKTQVFPLDKSDFVRTRLTHSTEVSTIARQLGIMLSANTTAYRPKDIDRDDAEGIASVLLCAGLLHDLGNPPFGHFGETTIGDWFRANLGVLLYKGKPVREWLAPQMVCDLEHFEGNAQALRILLKARHSSDINISAAIMGTLVKYPTDSLSFNGDDADIKKHKPGVFLAEEATFSALADTLGMRDASGAVCRHPLTYMLEAADDIAYATADLEDAHKKGLFTLDEFITFFANALPSSEVSEYGTPAYFSHDLLQDLLRRKTLCGDDDRAFHDWLHYTRRWLMYAAVFRFSNSYAEIMAGTFRHDLFHETNHSLTLKLLKKAMGKFAFNTPGILKLELSAQTILFFLLDGFIRAVLYYDDQEADKGYVPSKADKKYIAIFSDNFKKDYENTRREGDENFNLYLRMLMVTDYISGMTDSYARTLYRELSGIE